MSSPSSRSARACSAPRCDIPMNCATKTDYFDDIKNPKISKDMIELAGHILDAQGRAFRSRRNSRTNTRTRSRRWSTAQGLPAPSGHRRARRKKPDNRRSDLMDALKQSLKAKARQRERAATRRATHRRAGKKGIARSRHAAQASEWNADLAFVEASPERRSPGSHPSCVQCKLSRRLRCPRRFAAFSDHIVLPAFLPGAALRKSHAMPSSRHLRARRAS